MYITEIVSNVAVGIMNVQAITRDNHYEITQEQFDSWYRPCYAEMTENGVVFGDIVPWDKVPDTSVIVEENPEPIIEEPT